MGTPDGGDLKSTQRQSLLRLADEMRAYGTNLLNDYYSDSDGQRIVEWAAAIRVILSEEG